MEKKINIAELLKNCPQGMKLDCINYDGVVTFEKVIDCPNYPIIISIKYNDECCKHTLTKYGQTCKTPYNKCIIFPKGKTTWEGFVPPCKFKDGDVVSTCRGCYTFILKGEAIKKEPYYKGNVYFAYCVYSDCMMNNNTTWYFSRLATEEEKQKLFDAIKANGYKWNPVTKTLEKLIEPKFKVGDRIDYINSKNKDGVKEGITLSITGDTYDVAVTNDMGIFIPIADQDNWELIPNKFDISTLKPFDKVLVRNNDKQRWTIDYFSFADKEQVYPFVCIGHYADQCIPYEGNEHLLGTTNNCDEYYKTWK